MTLTQLSCKLSKYGMIELIKESEIFTLLISGENLTKMDAFMGIQKLVTDYTKDKYPFVEAMTNTDYLYCIILKK